MDPEKKPSEPVQLEVAAINDLIDDGESGSCAESEAEQLRRRTHDTSDESQRAVD